MTKKQVRKCARCGHEEVLDTDAWEKIERAARHKGCGGAFPAPMTRIGGRR